MSHRFGRRILGRQDDEVDVLESEDAFGDAELAHEITEKIAYRECVTDPLAVGVARCYDELGVEDLKTNVNLPNVGQIPNLPEGAVVETNALFSQGSVIPLTAGELPDQVRNMTFPHVQNQETIIEAAFASDVDLAFQAFLNDPLVTVGVDDAKSMFRELVDATRPYLEDHWSLDEAAVLD